jgi:5-formyltetrahydrofolate cyclo-ligase
MRTLHKQPNLRHIIQIVTSLYSNSARSPISEASFHKLPSTPSPTSRLFFDSGANRNNHFMSSPSVADTESSFEDVRKKKQELRKQLRSTMKNLTVEDIDAQSNSVWRNVFELPIYRSAKSVGLFLSMPMGEINTDLILLDCVQNGKDIYVPEVGKNFELCDMALRKVILNPTESMAKTTNDMFHKTWPTNKWKIPEPPVDMPTITAEPGDIDLMIVPGLGFDRTRNRLGQGKGYYDRFIAKMTMDGKTLPLVAVALKPQLVEDTRIPVAPYDRQMDMVVLPDEVIAATD